VPNCCQIRSPSLQHAYDTQFTRVIHTHSTTLILPKGFTVCIICKQKLFLAYKWYKKLNSAGRGDLTNLETLRDAFMSIWTKI